MSLAHNVFDDDALALVARSTDGILRLARNLSISCLLEAVRSQKRIISLGYCQSGLNAAALAN